MSISRHNLPRLFCFLFCVLFFAHRAEAQNEVAIGSNTTKSNAILWLNGNGSQGLILPVVPNKSNVSNPDKGMIVYDLNDNKVWYRNDNAWVEVGAGASSASLNLQLQGNQLQLRDGTTVLNSSNLSSGTPADGTFLVFSGGAWQAVVLSGDVAGANGTLQVNGIKGKVLPTLPSTAQALVYDGAAWKFQALTGGSDSQSLTFTSPNLSISNGNSVNLSALDKDAQTLTLSGSNLSITGGNSVTLPSFAGVTSIATGAGLTGGPITTTGTINVDVGTTANKIVQLDGTGKLPAVDGSQLTNLPVVVETGDISAVVAGTGLTGGSTTGSATLNVDVGTTANKIVQLDGTGKLPAMDGSQLTNLPVVAETGDISAVVAGTGLTGGTATGSATLNVDIGTTANKIVQLDGTGKLPAVDGSLLTNLAGDISGVVAGTGLTGGATTGSATLNVDVGTTANKIVQLDGTGKLPAIDGSQLINLAGGGDITGVSVGAGLTGGGLSGNVVLSVDAGTTANKIVQLDGTGKLPAVDGSQLTNLPALVETGDISAVVAGTGLTGGAATGSATLNVDVGTTANKIVQLDGTGKLPVVDGSQLTNLSATNISSGSLAIARITPSVTNGQVLTTTGGVTTWQTPAANADAQDLTISGATLSLSNDATPVTLGGLSILNTISTNEITDLTIANADISGTAAIAGTKITPAFGTQNISTTGTLSAGATTVTGLTIGTSVWPTNSNGVLTNNGTGALSWASSFTNPMTNSGDIIYGGAAGAATRLAGASGFLKSNGTTPSWSAVDLTGADVTGILGVANGGTGRSTWDGLLLGTGATISDISTGTAGQILKVTGTTPSWQDFLITSTEITDLSILNADVNTNAAIDGTKINPAFGTQDISTTGNLTISGTGEFASEVGIKSGPLPGTTLYVDDGTTRSALFNGDVLVNGSLAIGGTLGIQNDAVFAAGNTAGLDGQVLTSQGTGVAPIWKDASSFSTLNTIPKGNGTTLTASQIFDDGTNVGIGTLTPTARLHVQGPGNFDIANTEGDFKVGNGTHRFKVGVAYAGGGAGDVYMGPQGGTSRLFIGGGTTLTDFQTITIGGGNVGIGNTVPSAKLEVVGVSQTGLKVSTNTNNANEYAISAENSGTTDVAGFFLASNPAGGVNSHAVYGQAMGAGSGVFGYNGGTTGSAATFMNSNAGNANPVLQIWNSGTGPALITTSGNVGLGSSSPLVKLSVRGRAYIWGDGDGALSDGDVFAPTMDLSIDDNDTGFEVPADGQLAIYSNNQEQIRITTGNVGIGTPAPDTKLHVAGSIKMVDGTQQAGYVLTSDANGLASWQSPAAVTGWGTTGNAGITDANFIGPNTSVPFNIKINSIRAGRVDPTNQDTFFGYEGGRDNISGTNSKNTAFGGSALRLNKYGFYNTAIGQGALYNMVSTAGASYNANNTAVGFESLYATNNSTATSVQGIRNTAIGSVSGHDNVTGNENVFVGYNAGVGNISGGNNTFVGFAAAPTTGALNNATAIGNGASVNASNKIVLGNASATTVGGYGGFTNYSDRRLKENISYSNDLGLNFIMQLKTATYNYKSDINKRHRNGMIAQDVEDLLKKLNIPFSGLVIDDDAERTLNLSYSEFVMPLINSVQEQQKMIDEQKSEIEKLKAQLNEKDDKLNSLQGSVSSMREELESIKEVLGIEAKAKTAGKK